MYPIYQRICTKREVIYIPENIKKLKKAYTIGSGKIGTWYGTGVNALLYTISIPNVVSLP